MTGALTRQTRRHSTRQVGAVLLLAATLMLGGCGYNDFQKLDESGQVELERGAEPVPAAQPTSFRTSSTPSRAKPTSSRKR